MNDPTSNGDALLPVLPGTDAGPQWLGALVDSLRPTFAELGSPLPERIRVSCGWPSKSALSPKAKRIGEAWSARCSTDGAHETFLSPSLADPIEVGAVLVHELVHHAVGVEHGHRGPFTRLAKASGNGQNQPVGNA